MRNSSLKPLLLSFGLVLLPAPPTRAGEATAVLAGGCFWGVEYVFEHVRGVRSVISGFATASPSDLPVPVEAVRIDYDPEVVSYRQLLEVFFAVVHDPTSRDRQGPDAGPEYRAVVFTLFPGDAGTAKAYIAALAASKRFSRPIVTEIRALDRFKVAEAFHQDYSSRHLTEAYVVQNDLPKLAQLKQKFPALYVEMSR